MRGHKKWLALLLSLCMMVGAVPAMAEESVQPVALTEISEQPEAAVGEEPAAEEVPDEEPVILLGDEAPQSDPVNVAGSLSTWQNATVLAKGQVAAPTLSSYDSSFTNNQYWFAVNTDRAQQAIELSFTGVKKTMQVYVYSSETLTDAEPKSNNAIQNWNVGSNGAHSVKTGAQGTYYIMLRPAGSGQTATDPIYMAWDLLDGDLNEKEGGNDTWQIATELTRNVNTYFNLTGENDVDWFKITTSQPGEAIKLIFSNFDYTVPDIRFQMQSQEQVEAASSSTVVGQQRVGQDFTYSYKVNTPGTFYVKVWNYGNDYAVKDLKLRYEIVDPDANEVNDSFDTATALPDAYDMEYTLSGVNDEDWFKFETSLPNELVYLYFSGFDSDYSNRIRYDVYDAQEDSYGNSLDSAYIDMTHSKPVTLLNTGIHYVRVRLDGDVPVENTLKLRIERGVIDDGEPNETWQEAVYLAQEEERAYNLPSESDVDWFKFTVDKPNQTVELTFKTPNGESVHYMLYSGKALMTNDNSAGALDSEYPGSGVKTYRYMLDEAGDYYVRVNEWGGAFDVDATISYRLIEPDANERNNTWKTATSINEKVAMPYRLPADNDVDWFKFTVDKPDQTVELTFNTPAGKSVHYMLYSGEDFENSGDNTGALDSEYPGSGVKNYRYMLDEAGVYYVRVNEWGGVFDEEATITYTLIEPDAHERNNTRKTATTINEGVAMSYQLPASNDVDWFKFTVDKPDQTVELTFNTPAGKSVHYMLYSGKDFENSGDGARALDSEYPGPGVKPYRYMLGEAGDYYVCVNEWGGAFDEEATITYTLIEPDAHERNNTRETATKLATGQVLTYTLTADNDYDWFKLDDTITAGDTVTVSLGDLTSSVRTYLAVVKEGDTSETSVGTDYLSARYPVKSWKTSQDGAYYLQLTSWSDLPEGPMTVRYTVTRDDILVKGVESITNGDSTIFQGKTLQLYANLKPANATDQTVTWASNNTAAATVDANTGLVTGVAPGEAKITVTTKDGGFTATTTIKVVAPVTVTGVQLKYPAPSSYAGTETQPQPLAKDSSVGMVATVLPEDATERGLIWTVSNNAVLSVTEKGKVYALGTGTAKVTVTTVDGGHSAEFWFNVPDESNPVKGVSLDRSNLTLYVGETEGVQLTASVFPEYADNPSVIWSSDNEAVATVENGKVVPVAQGYATIKVTTVEGNYSAECAVSVQPQRTRVQGISFAEETMELGLYAEIKLQPIFDPVDATDQNVTWESSNLVVATVSRSGVVTALGLGDATITATSADGGYKATITIKVSLNAPYGDVDNNGDVNVADALLVLQASVGNRTLTTDQKEIADVSGDGRQNVADAILILRYSAGLIDAFPAEPK